ncbi:MAG: chemotaxis protein CheR [Candidatus Latescibacteria bacterium]|nr:chemotaxis protein CheR [Candidatus Latescibacterota bacterium]NIT38924.1 chemotaxis protein CheR [Candidatus Latescibacterota bacterium]
MCKRINRRMKELELVDYKNYQEHLSIHKEEWAVLDSMCRITISRFYRDRSVFDAISAEILPALGREVERGGGAEIRCWSAGCGSGEEPYTLQIVWNLRIAHEMHRDTVFRVVATDPDSRLLDRAQKGKYGASAVKDLPAELLRNAFTEVGSVYAIRDAFAENIAFMKQDIREESPEGCFHLVLCRNLVFTYFEEALQVDILENMYEKIVPGGYFIVGAHEMLPRETTNLVPLSGIPCIYRKSRS